MLECVLCYLERGISFGDFPCHKRGHYEAMAGAEHGSIAIDGGMRETLLLPLNYPKSSSIEHY